MARGQQAPTQEHGIPLIPAGRFPAFVANEQVQQFFGMAVDYSAPEPKTVFSVVTFAGTKLWNVPIGINFLSTKDIEGNPALGRLGFSAKLGNKINLGVGLTKTLMEGTGAKGEVGLDVNPGQGFTLKLFRNPDRSVFAAMKKTVLNNGLYFIPGARLTTFDVSGTPRSREWAWGGSVGKGMWQLDFAKVRGPTPKLQWFGGWTNKSRNVEFYAGMTRLMPKGGKHDSIREAGIMYRFGNPQGKKGNVGKPRSALRR